MSASHSWIDRGGTFTDIVAHTPEGKLSTYKLVSANPERCKDAANPGIKSILGRCRGLKRPALLNSQITL